MKNVVGFLCGVLALFAAASDGQSAGLPPVRIAYFVPSDREPIPGYQQRLDRVMQEVQRFYRDGMNAAGHGPMTFALERSADDALVVHLVRAKEPMASYGRDSSAAVRQEVEATLAQADIRKASVGWGRPLVDEVLGQEANECFLSVGGKFFEQGLFAHAPASHELELRGEWTRFRSGFGLQDGHDGSVVFVVRGDGRELFRSPLTADHTLHQVDVDISGVKVLELAVEDGGNGTHSDWGVWLQPEVCGNRAPLNRQTGAADRS